MNEQKEEVKEKKEPEVTVSNFGEGDKPKESTLIDDANSAAERLEKANERKTELLRQEEELTAKKVLGGRAEGGIAPVEKKETDEEYTAKVMRGEANPLKDDGV